MTEVEKEIIVDLMNYGIEKDDILGLMCMAREKKAQGDLLDWVKNKSNIMEMSDEQKKGIVIRKFLELYHK